MILLLIFVNNNMFGGETRRFPQTVEIDTQFNIVLNTPKLSFVE
jgi:hypothetical protein